MIVMLISSVYQVTDGAEVQEPSLLAQDCKSQQNGVCSCMGTLLFCSFLASETLVTPVWIMR